MKTLDDLKLKPNERAALEELRTALRERFGERLVKLVFYGSRARGDGDGESDLDVVVVIRGFDVDAERDAVDSIGADLGLGNGVLIHTMEFSHAEYEENLRGERPLVAAVEREGVPL